MTYEIIKGNTLIRYPKEDANLNYLKSYNTILMIVTVINLKVT